MRKEPDIDRQADPIYGAVPAAYLLAELPGKDLELPIDQSWLCGELASLCGARAAALYWPDGEGPAGELWSPEASREVWLAVARQTRQYIKSDASQLELGINTGSTLTSIRFPGPAHESGILLLDAPDGIILENNRDVLSWVGKAVFRQRVQSHRLDDLRNTCAELELRRAELLHSRDTLRALFDNTPTSMYIVGQDFTLLAVNRNRAELAGQAPQRLVGRRCYEGLFGRGSPCTDCLIEECLSGERSTRRVAKRVYPGGRAIDLEITSFPVLHGAVRTGQAIVFEEDVTERRRLEASLAQSEKLAAVGQLAAGVAHEINNPLTAVIANAQLLQRSLGEKDQDVQEMAGLILQAGQRAALVVQQLLDLSRQSRIELLPTDVNAGILRAVSLLQYQVMANRIQLKLDLEKGLPQILGSQDRLLSIWLNLLVNALDAVREKAGEITIRSRLVESQVEVLVEDNGDGIPPERLGQIFDPFYTTKEPGQGTGLGLSICHRVVQEHGGEIRAAGRPGGGTKFTVRLPITPPV